MAADAHPGGRARPLPHASDRASFRRPAALPGVELYRARIVRHCFDPHAHEGYGLGVIEAGAERFRYRGREHEPRPGPWC
jgi:hypothetical protein